MRSDPQRLLALAVRRIARAEDRAAVVRELCAVSAEHVADAVLVYLDAAPGGAGGPGTVPRTLRLAAGDVRDAHVPAPRGPSLTGGALLRRLPAGAPPRVRQVVEILAADPARGASLTKAAIARLAGTSEATVTRAVRVLGHRAFHELRLELARMTAKELESDPGTGKDPGGVVGGSVPALASVSPSGVLAEVLRAGATLGRPSPELDGALRELLGAAHPAPDGNRVLLAPLTGTRGVVGVAVFLRRPDREAFEAADVTAVGELSTHVALGVSDAPADGSRTRALIDGSGTTALTDGSGWRGRTEGALPSPVAADTVPPLPSRTAADALPPLPSRVAPDAPPSTSAAVPMPMRQDGDRLRFAGAATRRIARGIDLDEIVMGLCRATVPTFSDAILVYLRDPLPVGDERPTGPLVLRLHRTDRIPEEPDDGAPRPGPRALDELVAERCAVPAGGALAEVLRGVRPVFTDAPAADLALPELLGKEGESLVPADRHAILAPLRGRRRVIGAALFLRTPDRPAFEQNDLLIAALLATHSALGIDKAALYGREAYIADELQRAMLPETLPRPTGVRLASRYLPAAETARVGGDWYDAIPLPGSRVALVVGDVMGHSMTSAAIMGQLRTTAQTLAGLDMPPQEVLHHLDEQAQRLGTDRMATCVYVVYDPVAHRMTIANAGHPPPLLLHPGGRAEVLRVPPGAPIGVGGVPFEAIELDAPAGATLLLYTDGLVESRIRDVWSGMEQLRERLSATAKLTGPDRPPPLEALCDDVLDMLGPGDRDDDIALLAARFEGIAPSDVAYWFLEPSDATPSRARRLVRRTLTRWGLDELSDTTELLVSEIVTNAVRFASRPLTLRLLRTDVLRCEVTDDEPRLPVLGQARATDEGGRGLHLVNRVARRWGATRLSGGKVVWFELDRP